MRRICSCTALSVFRPQYLINPTDEARGIDGLGLGGEDAFQIPGILFDVSATNSFHFISFPVGIKFRKSPKIIEYLNTGCPVSPKYHFHSR